MIAATRSARRTAIVRAMVGRDLPPRATRAATPRRPRASRLRARQRWRAGRASTTCRWTLRAGEIVGLFGLVGSGRSELLETIFGLYAPDAGTIVVDGAAGRRCSSPRDAARAGIALVPEERQRQGLFFNLALRHNLVLPRAHDDRRDVSMRDREERALQQQAAARAGGSRRRASTRRPTR